MKFLSKGLMTGLIISIAACGGGGGGKSSSSGEESSSTKTTEQESTFCSIIDDTISLNDGESCELSESDAIEYRLTGEIGCNDGTLTIGSSTYSSARIQINKIEFFCGNK